MRRRIIAALVKTLPMSLLAQRIANNHPTENFSRGKTSQNGRSRFIEQSDGLTAVIPTAVSKYFSGGAIKPKAFREFRRLRDRQVTGRFAPQHVEIFSLIVRAYF